MRLPAIILTLLLVYGHTFAQFDYELFESYSSKEKKLLNSHLVSVTEVEQDELDRWNKKSFTAFNKDGLPVLFIRYNDQGNEDEKKEFLYDDKGHISKIKTNRYGSPVQSTEFTTDHSGKIITCTEYLLTPENIIAMIFSKTWVKYYAAGTMSRVVKLQWREMDTARIDYYDEAGVKISTINREMLPNIIRTEYKWNGDKTEMKEINHKEQGETDTITHTYKNNKEVGRIDASVPPWKFYWKYNNAGWLTETNELNFIQIFTYNERGYLKTITEKDPDPEPNVKEQPNKREYKYEYQFRQ